MEQVLVRISLHARPLHARPRRNAATTTLAAATTTTPLNKTVVKPLQRRLTRPPQVYAARLAVFPHVLADFLRFYNSIHLLLEGMIRLLFALVK